MWILVPVLQHELQQHPHWHRQPGAPRRVLHQAVRRARLQGRVVLELAGRQRHGQRRCAQRGARQERAARPDYLEHRDRRCPGRIREDEGGRCDRHSGAVQLRSVPGLLDRHAGRPRRQLLPADDTL